jgi:phage tail sheath protein FI
MTTYGRPGVYISERLLPAPIAVLGTANAAGAVIGEFAQGPETVTLVTSWYDFVKQFGGYNAAYPATYGVGLFFTNGGSELYVRRVLADDAASATATIPSDEEGEANVAVITAKNRGADGNSINVTFSNANVGGLWNLTVSKETVAGTASDTQNDIILETYVNLNLTDVLSSDFAETVVNQSSKYISIAITAANDQDPVLDTIPLTGGDDGSAVQGTQYIESVEDLSSANRPLVLFSPELNSNPVLVAPEDEDDPNVGAIYDAWISWAELNDGFVILDTTGDLSVTDAVNIGNARLSSSNAALYYPNVFITDPLGRSPSSLRKVGPAGAVAGLYLQTDKQTGPFKSPAGITASLRGVIAVEKAFTSQELDVLNAGASPINAIRSLPGAGVVVMGARTLKNDGTANKYVNTRRSLIFIKKSLNDLTQFALFENNDERLWARLNSSITVFLNGYLNQGGLRGGTAADAFYVKCDAENNPDDSIASGEVHIEIGVALQYPAEFVVINLSQKTSA